MDIILEILRGLIVFVIFMYLIFTGKKHNLNKQNGWWFLIFGFGLVLFGTMIDITDNFESLNRFIIIGDNEYQAFLEKVVGYLFGYLFLSIGICKWVPTVVALKKMQAELENNQNKLENEVLKRTQTLAEEVIRRKQAQDELSEFNDKLEFLVLSRTHQLKDTNQSLKKEISDRKQAEAKLTQSLKDTKKMLEAMPFGVVVVGKDKKIRMANKASLNLLGLNSEKEILDNICHKRFCQAKGDKCPVLDLGHPVDYSEKILIANDGAQIPILKSVLPIHYGGEEVLLEAFMDISQIKKVEAALISAKIEAETANMAKSEFLANMSHEFRTPLNHIIGFTQLVLDKSFGDLNETQTEYLEDASNSGSHLLLLINDILDLSKVESGKLELHTSCVKLRRLLENCLMIIKESAVSRRITLTNQLIDIPDTITADERKLKQILFNLLSNAVKFTPDGGKISLSARTCRKENSLLIPADEDSSHYVEISVSDNGIGLNPKDLDRIFSPFEQVDISSTKKFQGTGLGLSLTKSLIELHNGRIWVESDGEGKGSVFSCTIPMTPSDNISFTKNVDIVE